MCLRSSLIVYQQLFTDINSLGNGTLPYEDVPLDGRPQLYYNSNITLKSPFSLTSSISRPGSSKADKK
jgi:hypothetical protein